MCGHATHSTQNKSMGDCCICEDFVAKQFLLTLAMLLRILARPRNQTQAVNVGDRSYLFKPKLFFAWNGEKHWIRNIIINERKKKIISDSPATEPEARSHGSGTEVHANGALPVVPGARMGGKSYVKYSNVFSNLRMQTTNMKCQV